jgi:triacylglycerol esterase/lipase EstA (alpha/beta hydrolase family)
MKIPATARASNRKRNRGAALLASAACVLLIAGCATPIGADRVSSRRAYEQVERNALSAGEPSADAQWIIRRYGLEQLAKERPDEAVCQLHAYALKTGDRDVLYALSELSFVAGDFVNQSVKPWDDRDPRDFYLGAAVYSYLFLFSDEAHGARPSSFDRRFRNACDLYNHGLGLALKKRRDTNNVVQLEPAKRPLPVGAIALDFSHAEFPWDLALADKFLLADEFTVRGLSVRVRDPGLGAPLLGVSRPIEKLRLSRTVPATVFLRLDSSLVELANGRGKGRLELYSIFDHSAVTVGNSTVPLEADFTTPRAYTLNQSFAWRAEKLQFLNPAAALQSQLIQTTPYKRGLIPVVFVHGTFSSPVWWGEMFNTLTADPELRSRYQIWMFLYSSSNPILLSAAELRRELTNLVHQLDPQGQDPALRQMVVIGHSQGGLLTKLTATDTGDKIWASLSKKPMQELKATDEEKTLVHNLFCPEPLPEVKRVVFISTPHRGSFLAGGFVRRIVRRLVSTPAWMMHRGQSLMKLREQLELPEEVRSRQITSIDGMSPRSPTMLALADIPVATNITAHSIIAVKDKFSDIKRGNDGVVEYRSAHVDYAQSEFVVRSFHSCQDRPDTIEEVRRILHEHLKAWPAANVAVAPGNPSAAK